MDTLIIIFNWLSDPLVLPHLPAFIIGACFGIYLIVMGFQRNRITDYAEGLFTGLVIAAFVWALYQGHGMSGLASLPVPLSAIVALLHAATSLLCFAIMAAVTGLIALTVWSLVRLCLPKRPVYLRD